MRTPLEGKSILDRFIAKVHRWIQRRELRNSLTRRRGAWRCPNCNRLYVGEAVQRNARLYCSLACADDSEVLAIQARLRGAV